MSGILEDTATERTDLFTADAVAEILEGQVQSKEPLAFRMEWDEGVQAYIVAGVHLWEIAKPIHDPVGEARQEVLQKHADAVHREGQKR